MADKTARFSNWFQIISNVAIIVGLALIVYELNQSKQLAHAQFAQEDFQGLVSTQIATMGEDPREALAKAALHPADLNERDVVALDAYYESIVFGWFNVQLSSQSAGFDVPWRENVAVSVRTEFSSEPARRWLRAWVAGMDGSFGGMEVYEIAKNALQDDPGNFPRSQYELLLAND
jgi:hypothetical protein